MTDPGTDPRVVVALAALAEITDPADVGALVDATEIEPGVVDLHFASTMPGYVDWRWTVSTAVVEGEGATVLEVQLLPGEGSLLAPPWVPWTERLAEWRRSHPDEDAPEDADDDADEDVDDEDADDDETDDEDGADDDPFEAAGVEVEDVVIEESDDDESDEDVDDDESDDDSDAVVYGDSGEDDPADDDADIDDDGLDDGSDDDGSDDDADEPFRPTRGGDRF